jgi:large subunit ribosomal protein L25
MAIEIKLKAEKREESGSVAARRLRRAGWLPAALNRIGGGTAPIKLDAHSFERMLSHQSGEHVLVTLDVDGQSVLALLREVQHDAVDGHSLHADFGEVSLTQRIRVTIAIRLTGDPEGVRTEGGILEQTLREVEVECLPTDLVEHFTVDVSALKLGQAVAVRDLKLGSQYTVLTNGDVAVATVVAAAAEEVAAPAEGEAAAAEAGAEPEVIGKGKKEEEGEEAAEGGKAPEKAGGKAGPEKAGGKAGPEKSGGKAEKGEKKA